MIPPSDTILWITFAASLVPLLVAYLAVTRLRDRQRAWGEVPHPSRLILTTGFFLGGLGGMLFGIFVGPRVLVDPWTAVAITGPLIEETGKGLLPLALFAAGRLPNRAAGLAAGLFVGAGFAGVENLLFTLYGYAEGGEEEWASALQLRLAAGTMIHLTASGLLGYTLGASGSDRRPLTLIVAPISALAVSWLVHGVWNGGITLVNEAPIAAVVALCTGLVSMTVLARFYLVELRARAGVPTSASS